MSWDSLPRGLQLHVLSYLTDLDDEMDRIWERKYQSRHHRPMAIRAARQMLFKGYFNLILVCKTWHTLARQAVITGSSVKTLLQWASEDLANDAVTTTLRRGGKQRIAQEELDELLRRATRHHFVRCIDLLVAHGAKHPVNHKFSPSASRINTD
ncbi:uncharacterized protein BDW70DRAFT_143941 [Aspergillus foveolatus]|uniref:uncharacterized protein n=1 Tax=Aspergillus foveolatus TaxID=210207 RepID=UPI003CCD65A5